MSSKVAWVVVVVSNGNEHVMESKGVDPRDGFTRAMTDTGASGGLVGEELGVPMELLTRLPANADSAAWASIDGMEAAVAKESAVADFLAELAALTGSTEADLRQAGYVASIPLYLAHKKTPGMVANCRASARKQVADQ